MKQALARAWHWLGFGGMPVQGRDHSRFNFSPGLLASLEGEHGELLRLHAEIERLAADGRYTAIPAALATFKSKFDLHILHENLNFYGYVEEKAVANGDSRDLIRRFRGEMNAIARGVVNFVRKYRSIGVHSASAREFLVELRQVGILLMTRLQREETELYELYRP